MENKDLNNGSQENEWDEIIKNLNKKNSGIKEKSEEADIFFQKIKNGLKGKYDDLNFDNTFWGIKDEVESDAAKVEFTAEQQEINDKDITVSAAHGVISDFFFICMKCKRSIVNCYSKLRPTLQQQLKELNLSKQNQIQTAKSLKARFLFRSLKL